MVLSQTSQKLNPGEDNVEKFPGGLKKRGKGGSNESDADYKTSLDEGLSASLKGLID